MSHFDTMLALIAGTQVPAYVPNPSAVQWGNRLVKPVISDHQLSYVYRRYTIERTIFGTWEAKRPDGTVCTAAFRTPQETLCLIDADWEDMGGWPTLDMPEHERRGLIEVSVQAAYCPGMTWKDMRYYVAGLAVSETDWTFAREVFNNELHR